MGEFLADQVLYNLAAFEKYYNEGTNFNGIPSFIKLQTGQAQVQQTISGQVGFKLPMTGGGEVDPQITGTHQAQDNWTFAPVTDAAELNRLFHLYKAEFVQPTTNDLKEIFPNAGSNIGPDGRPLLAYAPIFIDANAPEPKNVLMISNQPQFTATFTKPRKPEISDVPGAMVSDYERTNGWFWFGRPHSSEKPHEKWILAGSYLGRDIWITNTENFFRFTLLVLGSTNRLSTSAPFYSLQNGLLVPLK